MGVDGDKRWGALSYVSMRSSFQLMPSNFLHKCTDSGHGNGRLPRRQGVQNALKEHRKTETAKWQYGCIKVSQWSVCVCACRPHGEEPGNWLLGVFWGVGDGGNDGGGRTIERKYSHWTASSRARESLVLGYGNARRWK